jgi:uncharacterized protein with PIN domain
MTEFLVDVMCGTLATYLRMCGHDAAYALDRGVEDDDELRALARDEGRVLVTRDVALAAGTPGAVCLRHTDVREQVSELRAAGYECALGESERCSVCNGRLEAVPADAETPADAPDPDAEPVWRCRDCGQLFWKGSHWAAVRERLAD